MTSVLITAFEPYDRWRANSSWLAMVELTRDLPSELAIVTRRYPVDFAAVPERLARDLEANYDFALHLGQAPGATAIRLEAIGVNVGGTSALDMRELDREGPAAFRTRLPLAEWAELLCSQGIPTQVSYHAGTYLCNAIYYQSCLVCLRKRLKTQSLFVHLPLDVSQAAAEAPEMAALPAATSALALRMVLAEMAQRKRILA